MKKKTKKNRIKILRLFFEQIRGIGLLNEHLRGTSESSIKIN